MQSVPVDLLENPGAQDILLDSYEIDLITGFIEGKGGLIFDDDGCLVAGSSIKRGVRLSPEGLLPALKKIIKSYEVS